MPSLKQTEVAIEEFALREIVRPHTDKFVAMHEAIQRSNIASEFNDDYESAHAAFANRMADGVYDAVVTVIEEHQAAATVRKPPTAPPPADVHAGGPRQARVAYGPGKIGSIAASRITAIRYGGGGAYAAATKDGKTHLIAEVDFKKLEGYGVQKYQPVAEQLKASVAAGKTAKRKPPASALLTHHTRDAKGRIQSKPRR